MLKNNNLAKIYKYKSDIFNKSDIILNMKNTRNFLKIALLSLTGITYVKGEQENIRELQEKEERIMEIEFAYKEMRDIEKILHQKKHLIEKVYGQKIDIQTQSLINENRKIIDSLYKEREILLSQDGIYLDTSQLEAAGFFINSYYSNEEERINHQIAGYKENKQIRIMKEFAYKEIQDIEKISNQKEHLIEKAYRQTTDEQYVYMHKLCIFNDEILTVYENNLKERLVFDLGEQEKQEIHDIQNEIKNKILAISNTAVRLWHDLNGTTFSLNTDSKEIQNEVDKFIKHFYNVEYDIIKALLDKLDQPIMIVIQKYIEDINNFKKNELTDFRNSISQYFSRLYKIKYADQLAENGRKLIDEIRDELDSILSDGTTYIHQLTLEEFYLSTHGGLPKIKMDNGITLLKKAKDSLQKSFEKLKSFDFENIIAKYEKAEQELVSRNQTRLQKIESVIENLSNIFSNIEERKYIDLLYKISYEYKSAENNQDKDIISSLRYEICDAFNEYKQLIRSLKSEVSYLAKNEKYYKTSSLEDAINLVKKCGQLKIKTDSTITQYEEKETKLVRKNAF